MADKQTTIYVIDVGKSMGEGPKNGRTETDLEYVLKYVWDKITSTVWHLPVPGAFWRWEWVLILWAGV